jgi:hypothetical protein
VDTELVLIYLDDFYLRSPVDVDRLDACVQFMIEDQKIACILLTGAPPPYKPVPEHSWLAKRSKSAPYLFSLQAGLWRKSRLLHFLRNHESPWYFERWGSIRGRRYPDDFYALAPGSGESIFNYRHEIIRGMWRMDTAEFLLKEGILIDMSCRPTIMPNWEAPPHRRNWTKTAWNIWRSLRP